MRNYPDVLLDPAQSAVVIIDHQPQMYFGAESSPRPQILNNVVGLAKAAQVFGVPCILTTVEAQTFSGNIAAALAGVYPEVVPIDRTTINCWEDINLKAAVNGTKRRNIILAGLWTEACVTYPALSMSYDGFKVFIAADACGGASRAAHEMAIERMVQAGVIPCTWQQIMLEWQRDWNNKDTYDRVMSVIKAHSGAYGLGVEYADTFRIGQ
jgi:nicotinamidase-related amidase